jgi:hypothetical protein
MKYTNYIRIVCIPGSLENLSKFSDMGFDIPEVELFNFSSNLGCELENMTFKDDKDLKKYIIEYFKNSNFLNHRRIEEVIILTLKGLYDNSIDFKSYFLTYCEVKVVGGLDMTHICFDREDFIEYIKDYDTLKEPVIRNDVDDLPF